MLHTALRVFLVVSFACAAQAQWESVGNMSVAATHGDQITFRNRKAVATVTVLAPDVVRVRVAQEKSFDPGVSPAVDKIDWPAVSVRITRKKSIVHIRTTALDVRIQQKPFGIAFHEVNGQLISRDAQPVAFNGSRIRAWKELPAGERYYGLGERVGPLELNGRSHVLWNTDPSGYDATTGSMYVSVPFFLALRDGGKAYGIFFDNPHRPSFDFGAEFPNIYSFGAEGGVLDYYFFGGPDPKSVLRHYTELTGRAKLPPLWSLGYVQSSMHYYPESRLRAVAENFRKRRIPCDGLSLDNGYMLQHQGFTWDASRFPDPKAMLSDLYKQGFHIIVNSNPGIKEGHRVYEQGVAGNHFLRRRNGDIYTGIMWPGISAFPDFSREETRAWWGSLYKDLLANGIASILADMDEPTVSAIPLEQGWVPRPLDDDVIFYDNGLKSVYAKNHNMYGFWMSQAIYEGLLRLRPNERPFVITRATYAGGQRHAAQWTGDNLATWEDLRASIRIALSMGLSGLPFVGSDTGGFIGMPSAELYTRWLQLGVFNPFFWTHSASVEKALDPWSFGEPWEKINRETIELRYQLLPYLYNAFYESTQTGLPIMRALLLDYPDDETAIAATPDRQNYEFLFGNDLLIAPVVREGETKRIVYLPKGVWYDFWTEKQYQGPVSTQVSAPVDRIPIFVRGGASIPMRQVVEHTGQTPINPLTFEIYPEGDSSRTYHEDDGVSFDYRKGVFLLKSIDVFEVKNGLHIELSAQKGSYTPPARSLMFKIHGQKSPPRNMVCNGEALEISLSVSSLEKTALGAAYDTDAQILLIKVPDRHEHIAIDIER